MLEQPLGQGGNNNNNNNNTPRATPELSSIVLGGAGLLAFGGYALARRRVSRVR
jgi:MYXO-CTERM domain-containing protein